MSPLVCMCTLIGVLQAAAGKPLVRKAMIGNLQESSMKTSAADLLQEVQRLITNPRHGQPGHIHHGEDQHAEDGGTDGEIDGSEDPVPVFNKVKNIKQLVDDVLFKELRETHAAAVEETTKHLASVAKCNADALQRSNEIKNVTEVSVGTSRSEHMTCRIEEKAKLVTRDLRCGELDDFLDGVNDPATLPAQRPRAGMVDYVGTMSDYYCPKGPEVRDKDDKCTKAEEERVAQKEICDLNQVVFESDFCTWRTELIDNCNTHAACYAKAKADYDSHVASTTELVIKWKLEWKSLDKITCYTNVWLKDSDVATADVASFDACNDKDPDTTPMDVDYGTPELEAACPLTAVEHHPGTPGFPSIEYKCNNPVCSPDVTLLPMSELPLEPLSCISNQPTTTAPPSLIDSLEVSPSGEVGYMGDKLDQTKKRIIQKAKRAEVVEAAGSVYRHGDE